VERAIAAVTPAISLSDEAGWYDKLNALSEGTKTNWIIWNGSFPIDWMISIFYSFAICPSTGIN
jgi:hypothetical protein